ncbi:MAG: membrane protein insertase YidC [Gammaproteobacteria bacterium]|nr:membrane protein insertase YidC [Gammaproteobacteria bacterium]MDE0249338.1 membrane protein insertase YidC [Gammaproteobacteria bacterium]
MSPQQRFVLAIVLMMCVLVGGNLLFPPPAPLPSDPETVPEAPVATPPPDATPPEASPPEPLPADPALPDLAPRDPAPDVAPVEAASDAVVTVEGPLYRFSFSTLGARLRSAELHDFQSFTRDGSVQLVEDEKTLFGSRIVVEADTVELRGIAFQAMPASGLRLVPGGEPETLEFTYEHPTQPFGFRIAYTFDPDSYVIGVSGRAEGLNRGLLVTDLGSGLASNEIDVERDEASLAYVVNQLQSGIRSTPFQDVEARTVAEGPLLWAATRSTYFVVGMLPPEMTGDAPYLGGLLARPAAEPAGRGVEMAVTQSLGAGGSFEHRVYVGPQEYSRLAELGSGFQDVNPVGWRWLQPVLRPIIGVIMWVLVFFHTSLAIGYGWVLILVGVLMRIVLFPLNHKAMRANLRNMAVQPLVKEIQTKYKDQPEKLQKEMVKLYKEHGFNPFAGCLPMLLPWPVLIALFFVFQNTIELRGVPFAWLPDLSTADPFYILPVLLGVSMFLMQWISMRTMEEVNPQMKMMLWGMPVFMVVIFANLPAGLNLYYLTANVATLPQSWWVANERKKVRARPPPALAR